MLVLFMTSLRQITWCQWQCSWMYFNNLDQQTKKLMWAFKKQNKQTKNIPINFTVSLFHLNQPHSLLIQSFAFFCFLDELTNKLFLYSFWCRWAWNKRTSKREQKRLTVGPKRQKQKQLNTLTGNIISKCSPLYRLAHCHVVKTIKDIPYV